MLIPDRAAVVVLFIADRPIALVAVVMFTADRPIALVVAVVMFTTDRAIAGLEGGKVSSISTWNK